MAPPSEHMQPFEIARCPPR